MDIYCTKCGEPWAVDCLHDHDEYELTREGNMITACPCCKFMPEGAPPPPIAQAAAALHALMPDDPDGVASMMDDADMLGLL